jgi:hypothetical protein
MAGFDSIKQLHGDDLIAAHKERYGDKTLLAFSRKDSIAVALDNAVHAARFISIWKHGSIRPVAGRWTPIWDWSKQKLLDAIEKKARERLSEI